MLEKVNLVKTLISLLKTKGVKVAELAGIKTPNYYKWVACRPNSLSDERVEKLFNVLGVTNGTLDSSKIHRWYESDNASKNINSALLYFINKNEYSRSEIYHIRSVESECFNILKLISEKQITLVICFNANSNSNQFPIDAKRLGFGVDKYIDPIPTEVYSKWINHKLSLELSLFKADAATYLPKLPLNDLKLTESVLDQTMNLEAFQQQFIDLTCTNAGLKVIIRRLLRELRRLNSKSILLNTDARKEIFDEFYDHEYEKLTNNKNPDF